MNDTVIRQLHLLIYSSMVILNNILLKFLEVLHKLPPKEKERESKREREKERENEREREANKRFCEKITNLEIFIFELYFWFLMQPQTY